MQLILISLLLVLLAGCGSLQKVVSERYNVYFDITCPPPPAHSPLKAYPIKPMAIKDETGTYWVALTGKHYTNLALNTEESIRVMLNKQSQIRYYRKCIDEFNENIGGLRAKQPPKEEPQ